MQLCILTNPSLSKAWISSSDKFLVKGFNSLYPPINFSTVDRVLICSSESCAIFSVVTGNRGWLTVEFWECCSVVEVGEEESWQEFCCWSSSVELPSLDGIFEFSNLIFFKICGSGLLDLILNDSNGKEEDDDEDEEGGEIDDVDDDEFWHENDETESDCKFVDDLHGLSKGDDCFAFSKELLKLSSLDSVLHLSICLFFISMIALVLSCSVYLPWRIPETLNISFLSLLSTFFWIMKEKFWNR